MRKVIKDKGFTLVELLVAMAIIGMLIMLIYAAVGVARRAARDTARKSDLQALELEVEDFYGGADIRYPLGTEFVKVNNSRICVGDTAASCTGGNLMDLSQPTQQPLRTTAGTVNETNCRAEALALMRATRDDWVVGYMPETGGDPQNYCMFTHLENGQEFVVMPQH